MHRTEKKIQKEKKLTLLLITHDLGVVFNICDEIAVMYSGNIIEKAATKELFKNPKHPYTIALLNSLPSKDNEQKKLLEGQPPAITEIINGCKFNPRCPYKTEVCTEKIPELLEFEDNHQVACFNCKI